MTEGLKIETNTDSTKKAALDNEHPTFQELLDAADEFTNKILPSAHAKLAEMNQENLAKLDKQTGGEFEKAKNELKKSPTLADTTIQEKQ